MLRPSATVELIWQDESGNTATTTLSAPSDLTVSEIDADATALASILLPLSGCILIGTRIRYKSAFEAPVPATGSTPITRTGIFFFSTDGDNSDTLVSVPAIKDSIILSDGVSIGVGIDTMDSDVLAFITAVIDNGISNPFADDITGFVSAYLQSRV